MSMSMTMFGQTSGADNRSATGFYCTDGSLGSVETAAQQNGCSDSSEVAENTINVVSVCPGSLGPLTNHTTIVFPDQNTMHFVDDGTSSYMTIHMIGDWKWVGPCPSGVKSGETGQMVNGNFEPGANPMATPQASP